MKDYAKKYQGIWDEREKIRGIMEIDERHKDITREEKMAVLKKLDKEARQEGSADKTPTMGVMHYK